MEEKKKRDNEFKFIGVLIELGDYQEGETSRGPWQNQRFKVQEYGDYAQVVEFTAFGQTVDHLKKIPLKTDVEVVFTIQGKTYPPKENGDKPRHYNTLRASYINTPRLKVEEPKKVEPKKETFSKPDDMPF